MTDATLYIGAMDFPDFNNILARDVCEKAGISVVSLFGLDVVPVPLWQIESLKMLATHEREVGPSFCHAALVVATDIRCVFHEKMMIDIWFG